MHAGRLFMREEACDCVTHQINIHIIIIIIFRKCVCSESLTQIKESDGLLYNVAAVAASIAEGIGSRCSGELFFNHDLPAFSLSLSLSLSFDKMICFFSSSETQKKFNETNEELNGFISTAVR